MQEQSHLRMRDPHFNVGDVVYIYDPVITPGNSIKLSRLWAGPYYVVEKPFAIQVKLRRVHDNKLIRNKVHVNRLKRGCLRSGLFDMQPPHNVDACELAILDVSELSPHDVNNIIHDNNVSNNVHEEIDDIPVLNDSSEEQNLTSQTTDNNTNRTNAQTDTKLIIMEKILRKKYYNKALHNRVKWDSFPSSRNSWLHFDDLSSECKQLVLRTHNTIPTDKKSQKKA